MQSTPREGGLCMQENKGRLSNNRSEAAVCLGRGLGQPPRESEAGVCELAFRPHTHLSLGTATVAGQLAGCVSHQLRRPAGTATRRCSSSPAVRASLFPPSRGHAGCIALAPHFLRRFTVYHSFFLSYHGFCLFYSTLLNRRQVEDRMVTCSTLVCLRDLPNLPTLSRYSTLALHQ